MLDLTNHRIAAETLTDLAGVHARRGALRDAIVCYERCLATMRAHGDRDGEAQTLASLAGVFLRSGRRADAIDCYDSCGRILREHGDRSGATQTLRDLEVAMRDLGAAQAVPARSNARTAS
ncbi:MAG: tetratricopeptide repeat protein [Solirubrobacteraceae bacterium]|nr:tetratricopeptide repeat protein [Solirubrobacteraceae bacterium]